MGSTSMNLISMGSWQLSHFLNCELQFKVSDFVILCSLKYKVFYVEILAFNIGYLENFVLIFFWKFKIQILYI
jgi:hypothetical protein